jgi:hypothetical protein
MNIEAIIPLLQIGSHEAYAERIVGMMRDHGCTMVDALLWDFESWGYNAEYDYYNHGIDYVEDSFVKYLKHNNVYNADALFYLDVFMGRRENYALRRINNNAKGE